jgi:hypothetical protein
MPLNDSPAPQRHSVDVQNIVSVGKDAHLKSAVELSTQSAKSELP